MSAYNDDRRTSDHSDEIDRLRHIAADPGVDEAVQIQHEAAAALLEVHDQTGLSLDNWKGPREFVEMLLGGSITENHV